MCIVRIRNTDGNSQYSHHPVPNQVASQCVIPIWSWMAGHQTTLIANGWAWISAHYYNPVSDWMAGHGPSLVDIQGPIATTLSPTRWLVMANPLLISKGPLPQPCLQLDGWSWTLTCWYPKAHYHPVSNWMAATTLSPTEGLILVLV
jgi:hypothetical protein